MREFQFHASNSSLILASSWNRCKLTTDQNCFVTKDLMLSEDSGITWRVLASYISQFHWGNRNSILVSYEPNGQGH